LFTHFVNAQNDGIVKITQNLQLGMIISVQWVNR